MALLQVERWAQPYALKNGEIFDVGYNVENYHSPSKPKRQKNRKSRIFGKEGRTTFLILGFSPCSILGNVV